MGCVKSLTDMISFSCFLSSEVTMKFTTTHGGSALASTCLYAKINSVIFSLVLRTACDAVLPYLSWTPFPGIHAITPSYVFL